VIIVEVGLPTGSSWSVTVESIPPGYNETYSTNTSALLIELANGTYSIEVALPAGYSANNTTASITVAGNLVNGPTVHAAPSSGLIAPPTKSKSPGPNSSGGSSGLTSVDEALLAALGIALVAVAVLAVALRRARPPKTSNDGP
jgi:hypothetical protein